MKELDRTKPFATIHGDVHGRIYEQDGEHFNADGKPWTPDQSPVGAENEEAAMRARIEKDVRSKVEKESKEGHAKLEKELRAKIEAETREKLEAEIRAKVEKEHAEKHGAGEHHGGKTTKTKK